MFSPFFEVMLNINQPAGENQPKALKRYTIPKLVLGLSWPHFGPKGLPNS